MLKPTEKELPVGGPQGKINKGKSAFREEGESGGPSNAVSVIVCECLHV